MGGSEDVWRCVEMCGDGWADEAYFTKKIEKIEKRKKNIQDVRTT